LHIETWVLGRRDFKFLEPQMATILVMEDDRIVRNVVTQVLGMDGHTVLAFEDAGPALKEADLNAVDLVLTDLQMPTPGETAIEEIRARGFDTPVVVMSGHVGKDQEKRLRAMGVKTILPKPFRLAALIDAVRALV
jgi:CheY-like chemotaxis protein